VNSQSASRRFVNDGIYARWMTRKATIAHAVS
jgi:hypothetical protein